MATQPDIVPDRSPQETPAVSPPVEAPTIDVPGVDAPQPDYDQPDGAPSEMPALPD